MLRNDTQNTLCRDCSNAARRGLPPLEIDAPPSSPHTRIDGIAVDPVETDLRFRRLKTEVDELRAKYGKAITTIDQLEGDLGVFKHLQERVAPVTVEPQYRHGTSEATAVLVASDWHVEERVDSTKVNGLNAFDLDIAQQRATTFFRAGMRLVRLLKQDVKIPTIVLPLLGDFITGQIHGAENAEANLLLPTDAIVFAQNIIIGGIEHMLEQHEGDILIVCHSGNHSRTTLTTRFGTEHGHSYEYLMYLHLATYFKSETRVRFEVARGYHTYLPIYDRVVRFHHGHEVKYGGGVGGIFIPTYKAISQWNKARVADLDVFGHFHQLKDGGNFITNGSLIGYNVFAQSIKADFEAPRQVLFLVDKKRGRTCTWPVLVSK